MATSEGRTDGEAEVPAGRALTAGVVGVLLSAPLLAVGLVASVFVERMMVSALLGRRVSQHGLEHGGESFLGSVCIAFATGAIGACMAGFVALKIVRGAESRTFVWVLAAGTAALLAAGALFWGDRLHLGGLRLAFYVGVACLGALMGSLVAGAPGLGDEPPAPAAADD